jgi:hypothetical protein
MADNGNEFTHVAYGYRRLGRKPGRLLECGVGRIDEDGKAHVYLDRTPLNFTGYIQLVRRGETPVLPAEKPCRPGEDNGEGNSLE